MDYFRNIVLFRRTVELGSISAAGRDMRISAGRALSGIVELEHRLGARLLYRSTRRLTPTEHGRVFYRESDKIIDLLWQAERNVTTRLGAVHRSLRISSPSQLSRYVVGPVIPEFHDLFPEIEIQLRSRIPDLPLDDDDIIFSFATFSAPGYVTHTSFEFQTVLVASSEYIERHGLPHSISDLLSSRHKCLIFQDCEKKPVEWQFTNGRQIVVLQPRACLRSNDEAVITGWAFEGLGIAHKPTFEVKPHLMQRRLDIVLGRTPPLPIKLSVTYRERYRSDPTVKQLLGLIAARLHTALTARECSEGNQ